MDHSSKYTNIRKEVNRVASHMITCLNTKDAEEILGRICSSKHSIRHAEYDVRRMILMDTAYNKYGLIPIDAIQKLNVECGCPSDERMKIHTDYYNSEYQHSDKNEYCEYVEMYKSAEDKYPNLFTDMKVAHIKYIVYLVHVDGGFLDDVTKVQGIYPKDVKVDLPNVDNVIKDKIYYYMNEPKEWFIKYPEISTKNVKFYKGRMYLCTAYRSLLEIDADEAAQTLNGKDYSYIQLSDSRDTILSIGTSADDNLNKIKGKIVVTKWH